MKALRGTKRVCRACAARFYDLSRGLIICPSCGAEHVAEAVPTSAEPGARARFTDKTGWRSRTFKHPDPDAAPEVGSTEDAVPFANDDIEEEADEADISGLDGHHESDPKER